MGARDALFLFLMTGHWRKPLEYSEETMDGRGAGGELSQGLPQLAKRSAPEGDWDAFERPRPGFQHAGAARAHARLAGPHALPWLRRSPRGSSGSLRSQSRGGSRPRRRARGAATDRPGRRHLRGSGPPAGRDRRAGWEVRDVPDGLRARAEARPRNSSYGRNAVREALRGRREGAGGCGGPSAQPRRSRGCGESGPQRPRLRRNGTHRGGADPRPSGRRRLVRIPAVRRSVGARGGREAAACVSRPGDRPTQPRRGGPLCRRGATGVVDPAHGSARVRPRSAGRRQARSSICRGRRPEPGRFT